MTKNKYYRLLNKFDDLDSVEDIVNAYPKIFHALCRYNFRLNNRIIDSMFDGLCYGNWKHLWETDMEKTQTVEDLCRELQSEVLYCSDRISWDRLLRIHWIWQRIRLRIEGVY